jgi:hypothetical protein
VAGLCFNCSRGLRLGRACSIHFAPVGHQVGLAGEGVDAVGGGRWIGCFG